MDSPYEGGIFRIDVKFPSEYPFKKPEMIFVTPIYHPGVNMTNGKICIETQEWKPQNKFVELIHTLINLLESPSLVDIPLNVEAFNDIENGTFNIKAREIT